MVSVSASVNLPLHHKVQRFSSGTGSPGWSRKRGRKTVVGVVVVWLGLLEKRTITTSVYRPFFQVNLGQLVSPLVLSQPVLD